jgi:hypothetical protein
MVKGTSRMRASVCASSVLPEPVGPDQQDVGLGELDVVVALRRVVEALVVVVTATESAFLAWSCPIT